MAKDHPAIFKLRSLWYMVFLLSASSFISYTYWCHISGSCYSHNSLLRQQQDEPINLLRYPYAWNQLSFPSGSPLKLLKIAVFVKKWPQISRAGGLERHAFTLHLALAKRGHELHIFTTSSENTSILTHHLSNLHFHLSEATAAGYLDQGSVWKQFQDCNTTGKPFDVVHTESVGLLHTRSRTLNNVAVSWHGIAYETIHSDIIQELLRTPEEKQPRIPTDKLMKVVEEVKFFSRYTHHVATSDYCGDVLKRIYMIPEERVHIILNGVDEEVFKPDRAEGINFRQKLGVPNTRSLIFGMAGRLVRDKGHPLMFEALKQILMENDEFRKNVIVLVAGDGPWGARYRDLQDNVLVLGPMDKSQLSKFYNAIDIFVNPTLRAQGLDTTLLEATLSGKPVMATRFASITRSVIVDTDIGYTFSPTVESLKEALHNVWKDGRAVLQRKGGAARQRGLQFFTSTRMTAAYERLFLCISDNLNNRDDYCNYNLH